MQSLRSVMNAVALRAVGDDEGEGDSGTEVSTPTVNYGTAPTPSDTSKKYVDDANFTMEDPAGSGNQVPYYVILDQSGSWTWDSIAKNAELPVADDDGNLYYYYIKSVEETDVPAGTTYTVKLDGENAFLVGKDKHMDTSKTPWEPDPLEVNNVVKGSLKVTKNVTVNSQQVTESTADALKNLADGTYTFTIAGKTGTATASEQSRTIDITITNGVSSTVEVPNLTPGTYTVTEVAPTNGTALTTRTGGTQVDTHGIEVTVEPGKIGTDAPTVGFTNNIDTTQLTVNKVWSDNDTVDHSSDVIAYKLYRIPRVVGADGNVTQEYDPELVSSATGMTGRLTANNNPTPWSETISNLPKSGEYTPTGSSGPIAVTYKYYISEDAFAGYHSSTHGESTADGFAVTITNAPNSSFDKPTEVAVEKAWNDAAGNADNSTAHDNDTVTFRLAQKKYALRANGSDGQPHEYLPVRVTLKTNGGATSDLSTVLFVRKGSSLTVTPRFDSGGFISNAIAYFVGHSVRGNGFDTNVEAWSGYEFELAHVNEAREVTLALQYNGDTWGSEIGPTTWANTYGSSTNDVYTEEQLLSNLVTSGDPVATDSFDYSMALNDAKNDTVLTPLDGAQGIGSGTGKWKGKVTDLPYIAQGDTAAQFYVHTYEVSEIKIGSDVVDTNNPPSGWAGQTSGYYVNWSQDTNTGSWTITNQKKPSIKITIYKVDKKDLSTASPTRLPGAKFKLIKYTSLNPKAKDTTWGTNGESAEVSENTQNPGIFSFTGLDAGYYEIVETASPNGYIRPTENPIFWVHSDEQNNMVATLVYSSGSSIGQPIDGNATDLVKIGNTTSDGAPITVGNTPGAPLPLTGGPGTRTLMLLGALITATCGTLAFRRLQQSRRHQSGSARG